MKHLLALFCSFALTIGLSAAPQNGDIGTLPRSGPILYEYTHYLVVDGPYASLSGTRVEHVYANGMDLVYEFIDLSQALQPHAQGATPTV